METWLITGCSSGLGRELAIAALESGRAVVATARDVQSVTGLSDRFGDRVAAVSLDVRDRAQIDDAVALAIARFGSIDTLVNNAGHGYRAAVEEAPEDEVRDLFDTNFFGPVALIKAVLPGMRRRRSGAIVNVSSIAGRRTAPGSGYYSASKFALEGMSDGLRKEVGPLGIKVIVVDPGSLRTDFAGRSLKQAATAIPDYVNTAGLRRKENDSTHGTQPGDPRRAAAAIIASVDAPAPPFRLALGDDAVDAIGAEIESQRKELYEWEAIGRSIGFATH